MQSLEIRCPKCSQPLAITRYRCEACDLTLDADFALPPLARLSTADQAFVMAFVRVHGNIKKMEALFRVSYPTIKGRLNAVSGQLDASFLVPDDRGAILDRLDKGEITATQALELLDRRD